MANSEESTLKICDICLKSLANKAHLNAHAKIHQLPLSCLICHKGFARKDLLTRHSLLHDNEKSYECSSCDKSFSRKDNLVCHIKTHQSNKQFFQVIVAVNSEAYQSFKAIHGDKKITEHMHSYIDKTFKISGYWNKDTTSELCSKKQH